MLPLHVLPQTILEASTASWASEALCLRSKPEAACTFRRALQRRARDQSRQPSPNPAAPICNPSHMVHPSHCEHGFQQGLSEQRSLHSSPCDLPCAYLEQGFADEGQGPEGGDD